MEVFAAATASSGAEAPIVVNGCLGPRGNGYATRDLVTLEQARGYDALAMSTFVETIADMANAITMTNADKTTGVARAARDHEIPVAIAFRVNTDGALPTGQVLGEAVALSMKQRTFTPPIFRSTAPTRRTSRASWVLASPGSEASGPHTSMDHL